MLDIYYINVDASIPDNLLNIVIEDRLKVKTTVIVPHRIGSQNISVYHLPIPYSSIIVCTWKQSLDLPHTTKVVQGIPRDVRMKKKSLFSLFCLEFCELIIGIYFGGFKKLFLVAKVTTYEWWLSGHQPFNCEPEALFYHESEEIDAEMNNIWSRDHLQIFDYHGLLAENHILNADYFPFLHIT